MSPRPSGTPKTALIHRTPFLSPDGHAAPSPLGNSPSDAQRLIETNSTISPLPRNRSFDQIPPRHVKTPTDLEAQNKIALSDSDEESDEDNFVSSPSTEQFIPQRIETISAEAMRTRQCKWIETRIGNPFCIGLMFVTMAVMITLAILALIYGFPTNSKAGTQYH